MTLSRSAGVLVHPTSLPGPHGIGDLGPSTIRFLDWAAEAGLKVWQVLPLGPTGPDGSPYSSPSAFAGNPLLVSPTRLAEGGWLPPGAESDGRGFDEASVAFGPVRTWKTKLLRLSWDRFRRSASPADRRELESFIEHPDQEYWLEDWVLYAAIKHRFEGRAWTRWDRELRLREPAALRSAARELADETAFRRYVQFLFFRQWNELRRECDARGLALFGDLPFYVAHDSADMWAHRELFDLDGEGRPIKIAGVPPDYFSETGQLWGNPVYRWSVVAEQGYAWWIERTRTNLRLVGSLRLDHFRGFHAYWEVDAFAETAADGRWVSGPGSAFFDALSAAHGELPLIAEDLGLITKDVEELRDRLGLPGMRVLQFAFNDPESTHLPEHHVDQCVVYTGTHDNNTLRGWFGELDDTARQRVLDYLGVEPREVVWKLIEAAYHSRARLALAPLQDLLGLDGPARMNRPGTTRGNWRWRVREPVLTPELATRLRDLASAADR
jgi:4-alpha-glucanotransferase